MDIIILLILIGIITFAIITIATAFVFYIVRKIKIEKEITDLFEDYFNQFQIEEVEKGIEKLSNNLEKVYDAFKGWTKIGQAFNRAKTRAGKKNPNQKDSPKV